MNKRTITILSIVGIVLFIVGIVVAGAAAANAAASCQNATDTTSCVNASAGGLGIAGLVYLLGIVASLIAWIMGLVKTAQIGRWGWFVAVLLISPLGSLLYGLAGPEERAA